MFRCCKKKAIWYLSRDLGKKVAEEPLTVQLTFVPKGVGHVDDPYFLQEMHNRCVVCGKEDQLTRHHIVPYCYRKFFPDQLKNHRSFDVMALCIPCHHDYEYHAMKLKQTLADEYCAPVSGTGTKYDRALAAAKGAAAALLSHREHMPLDRQQELVERISRYLEKEPTDEDLQALLDKDPYDFGNYTHHGKLVIEQVKDIEQFVQKWRFHFVDKMKPKFLPMYWSVYRSVSHK